MWLFGHGSYEPTIEENFKNPNEVLEMMIVDEVSQLPDEKIQEFCQPGGVGEVLVSEGKLKNKTLVRLSKKDDLSRRTKMMALQVAKEKNDPLWTKLAKNRIKERELIAAITNKYGTKATTLAKKAQNEYLHGGADKKPVLPKSFMKAGGKERLSED